MADDSTKQFVDITEIRDGVLVLKDGSMRSVIEVQAINFDLRSDDEQIAITRNFQSFLNSVDFPIQISVISRPYDIDEYIKLIGGVIETTENDLLRIQAIEYQKFIRELSDLSNIVSKKFYIVVPFYPVSLPSKGNIISGVKGILGIGQKKDVVMLPQDYESYSVQLLQRAELVYDGIVSMGMKGNLLREDELKNLFYMVYNPSQAN